MIRFLNLFSDYREAAQARLVAETKAVEWENRYFEAKKDADDIRDRTIEALLQKVLGRPLMNGSVPVPSGPPPATFSRFGPRPKDMVTDATRAFWENLAAVDKQQHDPDRKPSATQ